MSRPRIEPTFGGRTPPPLPPPAHRLPRQAAAPPPRGMSGCLIAAIVCAALAVPVLGILAAIALPAYQDYTLRARVAAANTRMLPLQGTIDRMIVSPHGCPTNGEAGIGSAESFAAADIARVSIDPFDDTHCGYEIVLQLPGKPQLDDKHLWWQRSTDGDDARWTCSSDIADRWLPQACRAR